MLINKCNREHARLFSSAGYSAVIAPEHHWVPLNDPGNSPAVPGVAHAVFTAFFGSLSTGPGLMNSTTTGVATNREE